MCFCVLVLGYLFSWSELFFSYFFTHNWFVAAFIMFLLLIPLVECFLCDIDNKTLTYFVILLTIFNVVFGFGYGAVNSNGYNAANFAYIYIVARWFKSYSDTSVYKRFASNGLLLWLICCVPLVVEFIILTNYIPWQENLSQKYFGYNNPFIILSTIGLFMYFSRIRLQNCWINEVAKGCFGIFLLHTITIFIYYRVNIIGEWYHQFGYVAIALSSVALFAACAVVALVVEHIKNPYMQRYFFEKIKLK